MQNVIVVHSARYGAAAGGPLVLIGPTAGHELKAMGMFTDVLRLSRTLAGYGDADGVGDAAEFSYPLGIAISPDGGALFVADFTGHKIRRVEVATGSVTTIAGSGASGDADGVGEASEFFYLISNCLVGLPSCCSRPAKQARRRRPPTSDRQVQ